MISIFIPNNNIDERKYILHIIFKEFLEINYKINISTNTDWEIRLKNGNKLIIEDQFFNQFLNPLDYLNKNNIPVEVAFTKNKYIVEEDIPIIFGNSNLIIEHSKSITCGIDIFASSFFMLTRWEEYVNETRDSHNRFLATESLAFKNNFLDRPIANEYVEMLKNMLLELDESLIFKVHKYQLFLTHDVDNPLKYTNARSGLREVIVDILKRKNIKLAMKNLLMKIKVHMSLVKDPYDTFDYLMDISEKVGVKSYFFFMGKGVTKLDNMYDSADEHIKALATKIKKRGHYIGIHPTYNAYNDGSQFTTEKEELEKNLKTPITFGREHFLRFETPTTWQIWEDNDMQWDSTLSFADKEGFRCGVCYEYSVFNILTRKKLNLKEKPLIVMEGSFVSYHPDINPIDMENKIRYLIDKVKKYNGDFVFLWHNSSFNETLWNKYQNIYEKVLK